MAIKDKMNKIKNLVLNNKKIIENYFFMTVLQVLNSFFYFIIFPYLINTLGKENYGLFVFATSIMSYFILIMNYGFDVPAIKEVAKNKENKEKLSEIVSSIFTAKNYLYGVNVLIFLGLLFFIPIFSQNKILFISCFILVYKDIIFPQWFFQGVQEMKLVTFIQLGCKLISLPLIFLFVKIPTDLPVFSIIVTLTTLFGGSFAFFLLQKRYGVIVRIATIDKIKPWFKEGAHFFYSLLFVSIKDYSVPVIIGTFLGMKDVAIYDLASKLVAVPRLLSANINRVIFPKLIVNIKNQMVKKIIRFETIGALIVMLLIIFLGKYLVLFLGGEDMDGAYYLSILLSFTIMSWMLVGAYTYFVFIPNNVNYLLTRNQFLSLISYFVFVAIGLLIYKNILILGAAIAFSALIELIYCYFAIKKHKLL